MSRAAQRHLRQRAAGLSEAYDTVVLSGGPVAYWTLAGGSAGIVDRTGHGHTGAYHNGSTPTNFPDGSLATAFDGATQYIEVPNHTALSVPATGILAIEAWIRPDILEFPHDEDTGYVHWLGKGEPGQHEYTARMYSFTNTEVPSRPNRISGYAFNLAGGLGIGSYFQDTVTPGQWIHYALVINTVATDGTYPTGYTLVYKNGEQRDKDSLNDLSIVPAHGTAPLRIGTRDLGSYFQGAVAKVAVYDYEPAPSTFRSHYQLIVPPVVGTAAFIQNIGTASAKVSGNTLAITVPAGGAPVGHTLIARVFHDYTSGGPTIADSRGNTYTRDRTAANGGTTVRASLFSCRITTALLSGDIITVTLSASVTAAVAAIDEFSNVLLPISIDAQDGLAGSSATPSLPLTTTNANDLIVGMVGVEGPSSDGYTEDTAAAWVGLARIGTTGGTANTNVTVNGAYYAAGTANTYTYAPTLGTSANWVEFLAAYKAT